MRERQRRILEGLPCGGRGPSGARRAARRPTVADLVQLERGRIIATHWTVGQDVPLRINGALIAWSEFEVVQNRLAVRLTELA